MLCIRDGQVLPQEPPLWSNKAKVHFHHLLFGTLSFIRTHKTLHSLQKGHFNNEDDCRSLPGLCPLGQRLSPPSRERRLPEPTRLSQLRRPPQVRLQQVRRQRRAPRDQPRHQEARGPCHKHQEHHLVIGLSPSYQD